MLAENIQEKQIDIIPVHRPQEQNHVSLHLPKKIIIIIIKKQNKKTHQPRVFFFFLKKNTSRKFQKKIIRDTSFPGSGLALFSVSGNTGIFPKTKAHCDIFKGSSRSPWLKPAE